MEEAPLARFTRGGRGNPTPMLLNALFLAAREVGGRSKDAGLGADIVIIAVIALLFVLMVVGWFAWQRRA